MGREVLLEIKNLRKYFPIKNFFGQLRGEVKPVLREVQEGHRVACHYVQ